MEEKDIVVLIQDFIDWKIDTFDWALCPNDLSDMINDMVWENIDMEVWDINWWDCDAQYNYFWEKLKYAIAISWYYKNYSTVYRIDEDWYEV